MVKTIILLRMPHRMIISSAAGVRVLLIFPMSAARSPKLWPSLALMDWWRIPAHTITVCVANANETAVLHSKRCY